MKQTVIAKNLPQNVYHNIDIRQYVLYRPEKKTGESDESKGKRLEGLGKRDNMVNQVARHILGMENHTLREIKIKDICQELRLNASFLSRKFHEERKYTLCEFIQQVKIERAVWLLRQDAMERTGVKREQGKSLSVNAISDQLGFSSTEYFIRCFKKRMGLPPHTYRKCLCSPSTQPPLNFYQ